MSEQPEPTTVVLCNVPEMAEHSVSTERPKTFHRGMSHREGGWPKEIDPAEPQDTAKWRKRLDKDPQFTAAMKHLVSEVTTTLDQNNAIDMFEDYFAGETVEHEPHELSASTVAVFRDQVPPEYRRGVLKISWHPEGKRFLGSYSSHTGASPDDDAPKSSLIWDVSNPNQPLAELATLSPLTCAAYYSKNPELIGSGNHAGLVQHYDLRASHKPVSVSSFEGAHATAVSEFAWLQSKTHSECVTSGTDGKILWWDTRNLKEPVDQVVLALTEGGRPLSAACLEWQQEAGPTKYLIGTEEGVLLSVNKKPKKPTELTGWHGVEEKGGSGKHAGPVYSCKRNPMHAKCFLSVGDWSVKIWLDELKVPLTQTRPSPALLTVGGWSPTRAGVFFAGRADGVVDFYDYNYRMNEVAYSHSVGNSQILSASMHGNLLAVGDAAGGVCVLKVCDELSIPGSNEKVAVGATLEREARREKNLDGIRKQMAQSKFKDAGAPMRRDLEDVELYLKREEDWLRAMGVETVDYSVKGRQA